MTTSGSKTAVKLLLAEDNPLVRDLILKGLEPFCEIEVCKDGADALLKVVDAPPDVILCDYKMPWRLVLLAGKGGGRADAGVGRPAAF